MAPPPPPDDEELMGAFLDCDDAAFEALAARLRAFLVRQAVRRGLRLDEAEDVAEEALVRLFEMKYPST